MVLVSEDDHAISNDLYVSDDSTAHSQASTSLGNDCP